MQNPIKILIDLKKESFRFDQAQQGDDIILDLTIIENGVPVAFIAGTMIELLYVNANNTVASVTGDRIVVNGNNVKITCPRDCTRSYGIAKFQLRITSTYQVSTFPIALTIIPGVDQGQPVSQNISTILEQLTAKNIECGETLATLNAWVSTHGDIVAIDTRLTTVETDKQNKTDNTLTTTSKNIVGAINENNAQLAENVTELGLKADKIYVDTKFGNMGNTKLFKGSCLFASLPTAGMITDDYWYATDKTSNYCYNGATWVDIGNNLKIGDATITSKQLSFPVVKGIISKNLFDKTDIVVGSFVDWTSGEFGANASYVRSNHIPIKNIVPHSFTNAIEQCAWYDINNVFISGINSCLNVSTYTPPSNAKSIIICFASTVLDTIQVEENSVRTSYASFNPKILSTSIIKAIPTSAVILTVDKYGNGDYTSIMDAVNNANDSVLNPVTIRVNPGIYEEVVNVGGSRYISLIGFNKNTCIIIDKSGLKTNCPLQIQNNCYVANITVIATFTDESIVTDGTTLNSYAVHCDYDGEGVTEFHNCRLISDCCSAIGVGMQNNTKLILDNCYMESNTLSNYNGAWYGTAFIHSSAIPSAINQHVTMKDCTLKGSLDAVLRLSGAGSIEPFDISLYNNMLWSKTMGKVDSIVGFYLDTTINMDSYGNNVSILNK